MKVNGNKIAGRVALAQGDMVTIGSQELVVGIADERIHNETRRLAAVTMTSEAAEPQHALLLLAGVVDKAFAMGRPEEAERILTGILTDVMVGLEAGRRDPATLTDATRYAMRLGAETGKASWLDWIFNAHLAAQRVLPSQTVDELSRDRKKAPLPGDSRGASLRRVAARTSAETQSDRALCAATDRGTLASVDGELSATREWRERVNAAGRRTVVQ